MNDIFKLKEDKSPTLTKGDIKGYCSMVFHVWKENGEICKEILEKNAGIEGFTYRCKVEYDEEPTDMPYGEWLDDVWKNGSYADEIAIDIAKEVDLKEDEDRYFEFYANYHASSTRDYWGECDIEEEIHNDRWQEISEKEWEELNDLYD